MKWNKPGAHTIFSRDTDDVISEPHAPLSAGAPGVETMRKACGAGQLGGRPQRLEALCGTATPVTVANTVD